MASRAPLSPMRKAIAASTTASAFVPQFVLDRSADLTSAATLLAELRAEGAGVSWEDLLVAVVAGALREHPNINTSFDRDAIVEHAEVNVGIATALKDGLVAPAITAADRRSLRELAHERQRLREGAREGRLRGVELYGATFTVSNLGPLGIDRFQALVIPPQAAILACGKVSERRRINLALSCDHRAIDGAPAARFLSTVCELLEDVVWLRELAALNEQPKQEA